MRLGGLVLLFVFCVVRFGVLVRGVGSIACLLVLGEIRFMSADLRLMGADARLVSREFLLRPFQDGGGFHLLLMPMIHEHGQRGGDESRQEAAQ